MTKTKSELLAALERWQGATLLVVGDLGLDEYVAGGVKRISPEAPVPVVEVENQEARLGLSGNVAQNIASLGGRPILVSVTGEDEAATKLEQMLHENGAPDSVLLKDPERPTTRKLRILAGPHHIVRVDFERRRFLSQALQKRLLAAVEENLEGCQAVIVQDYAKGVISAEVVQGLVALARRVGKPVLADPHRSTPLSYYRDVDLFKPNFDEALALTGLSFDGLHGRADVVAELGRVLRQQLSAENIVLTRGAEGMTIFSPQGLSQVPTRARQVFDVTGAGDTVIAALTLAWVNGLSLEAACQVANFAAGLVVAEVGCVPCEREALATALRDFHSL